ncbi:MAG: site-specific integrase [Lachnospiraceae bacterium]|nr:site-specific integrase [Lachnospiraceae bacterium]
MNEKRVTVGEIISEIITRMKQLGYEERTISQYYRHYFLCIAHYYRSTKRIYYDPDVTAEYLELQRCRYECNEISQGWYMSLKTGANRLNEFFITGTVHIQAHKYGTTYELSPENENLADRFVEYQGYGKNTCDDVVWVVRRYLHYFEHLGHESLSTVTTDDVRDYIIKTSTEMKISSLHNVLLYLKYFHRFLKENMIPAPDCEELFSYHVYREMPVQSYVNDTELDLVLAQIDRSTVIGKRNFAIIMIAATTGIRAIDIIKLKLSDIDWYKGEIKLRQEKTKKTVTLPLVPDAGEALKDYILNARPKSVFSEIFLRTFSPEAPITDATSSTSTN